MEECLEISKSKYQISNEIQMSKNKIFDLEERTAIFGEDIIRLAKFVKPDHINRPILTQLVKCGTSVGANYCEADGAESRKDFQHKMGISKKECKESKHFLRMLSVSNPECKARCRELWKEAQELTLIFSKIINNSKKRNK